MMVIIRCIGLNYFLMEILISIIITDPLITFLHFKWFFTNIKCFIITFSEMEDKLLYLIIMKVFVIVMSLAFLLIDNPASSKTLLFFPLPFTLFSQELIIMIYHLS